MSELPTNEYGVALPRKAWVEARRSDPAPTQLLRSRGVPY